MPELNVTLRDEYVGKHKVLPLTRENILSKLVADLKFGWEKSTSERGLSSLLMANVVLMWDWVLSDDISVPENAEYDLSAYQENTFTKISKKYNIPLEG